MRPWCPTCDSPMFWGEAGLVELLLSPPCISRGRSALSFPSSATRYLRHRPVCSCAQSLYKACAQISAPTLPSCGTLR